MSKKHAGDGQEPSIELVKLVLLYTSNSLCHPSRRHHDHQWNIDTVINMAIDLGIHVDAMASRPIKTRLAKGLEVRRRLLWRALGMLVPSRAGGRLANVSRPSRGEGQVDGMIYSLYAENSSS